VSLYGGNRQEQVFNTVSIKEESAILNGSKEACQNKEGRREKDEVILSAF
jgi:hypothetical protein